MPAEIDFQAPGGALRLIDEIKSVLRRKGRKSFSGHELPGQESGNHDWGAALRLIIHGIFRLSGIAQPRLHGAGDGLELARCCASSSRSSGRFTL